VNSGGTLRLDGGGAWTGGEISIYTNGLVQFNGGTGVNTASLNAYGGTVDVNGQSLPGGSWANFIARSSGAKLMNSSASAATIASGNNTVWLYTASVEIETEGDLQIDSLITSAAAPSPTGIIKTGPGTLALTATNDYTGDTVVSNGVLRIDVAWLADAAGVDIATGAKMDLNFTGSDTIGSLTLAGTNMGNGVFSAGSHSAFFTGGGSLQVGPVGPGGPAYLTNSVSSGVLELSWPAEGWRLQMQTNSLASGLGTNWVDITDGSVTATNVTINSAEPAVFFRLRYPNP
jgi:autotransporter-associated beta strand protein